MWSIRRRPASRGTAIFQALSLSLAANLLTAIAAHASTVSASLSGNMSTGQVGSVSQASTNGSPISGTLTSGAAGSFFGIPSTGASDINGTSAAVTFGAVSPALSSSQVSGQFRLAGTLTFTGLQTGQHVTGIIREVYSGSLIPNTTYEDAYHSYWVAHGATTAEYNSATAVVTGFAETLALGSKTKTLDYQSRICSGANCLVSDTVAGRFDFAFDVTKSEPSLIFDLDTSGSGHNGGGFDFDPIIQVAFDNLGGTIGFTGGDGFVQAVPPSATPIPNSLVLFATGCLGVVGLGGYRRARRA